MTSPRVPPATAAKEMFEDLQRLVDAIDRRVPHLERLNEAAIADDAAELRRRAVELMQSLEAAVHK